MVSLITISDIQYDPAIYPREKWNTSTVESYADVMKSGKQFPPLILEEGTNLLLDGVHRWKAYQLYAEQYQNHLQQQQDYEKLKAEGKHVVETPDEWATPLSEIPIEFHVIPTDLYGTRNGQSDEKWEEWVQTCKRLYAASLSVNHGDRISRAERKQLARSVYEQNPEFVLQDLSRYLSLSVGTSHSYVSDILARRKEAQKMIAYRLLQLGWTQQEVAEKVGTSQPSVVNFLSEFSDLKILIKNLLDEGHPHADVAKRNNMPLQLVWAIHLEDKDDAPRLEKLNISVQPYDVWNFGKCDDLYGNQHPGRIPGQLLAHVLYFFTQPGDVVIDPMCGSGTTQDVCLVMGRKCYGYDIDDRHKRSDVIPHNISKDGWPERLKKASLIFWDAPYFQKMDKSNIGENGYIDGSISNLERDDYLDFFRKAFTEAYAMVKPGTKLAFLMSDWDDNTGERKGIFVWDYANAIQDAKWDLTRHIQIPLSTQQVHPDIVNKFRKSRRLARLERYLLIAEKR